MGIPKWKKLIKNTFNNSAVAYNESDINAEETRRTIDEHNKLMKRIFITVFIINGVLIPLALILYFVYSD